MRSSSLIRFRRLRTSSWEGGGYAEDGGEAGWVEDMVSYMPGFVLKGSAYVGDVKADGGEEPLEVFR